MSVSVSVISCERRELVKVNRDTYLVVLNCVLCNRVEYFLKMSRRHISNVWLHFTKNKERSIAECNKCKKVYKTSGNTSNLRDHLKRFHPELESTEPSEDDIHDASTSSGTITSFFKKQTVYDRNSHRKLELDKALVFMVRKDFQPFSIVDDVGFKNFTKLLDPRYDLPSRKTLTNVFLKKQYEESKIKLLAIFEGVLYISLTCDLWTSRSNEGYLTVTSHFIDTDFNMRCAVLSTNLMKGSHTAKNIAEEIQIICNTWKIREKIVSIVTDNASSMIKACEILKVRHTPCFAHTLNLVLEDALSHKDIQTVVKKCKDIVTYFKCSNIATQKLLDEQEKINKKPLKLVQSCPTRWNSTLHMIQRISLINNEITVALSTMPKAPAVITLEDYLILQDLILILGMFDEATNKISGNYVTSSLVIPLVCGIHRNLLSQKPTTPEGNIILQSILESVTKRLFPYEERTIPRLSTLLDPRMKKEAFRSTNNAEAAVSLLKSEMAHHENNHVLLNENNENEDDVSQNSSTSYSLFGFMEERINAKKRSRTDTVNSIIVLRQYLKRPNEKSDIDPSMYWKVIIIKIYI